MKRAKYGASVGGQLQRYSKLAGRSPAHAPPGSSSPDLAGLDLPARRQLPRVGLFPEAAVPPPEDAASLAVAAAVAAATAGGSGQVAPFAAASPSRGAAAAVPQPQRQQRLRSSIEGSGAQLLLLGGSGDRAGGLGRAPSSASAQARAAAGRLPPSGTWLNRRNAWLRRFLRNCSENVEVPDVLAREPLSRRWVAPPMLLQPFVPRDVEEGEEGEEEEEGEESEEEGDDVVDGDKGSPPASPGTPAVLRRTVSLPPSISGQLSEELLSAEDVIAALAPRRGPPSAAIRRQSEAGCSDADLLQRLLIPPGEPGGRGFGDLGDIEAAIGDEEAGAGGYSGGRSSDGSSVGTAPGRHHHTVARVWAAGATPERVIHGEDRTISRSRSRRPRRRQQRGGEGLSAGWARLPKRLLLLLLACWSAYLALQVRGGTNCWDYAHELSPPPAAIHCFEF